MNISDQWETKKLGEVCEKITDGSHFSPPKMIGGLYPYITVRDINKDIINFQNCKFIDESSYKELVRNGCQPEIGDILFSKDGTIGKVSLVNEKRDFVVLSSLAILRPNKDIINPNFLKYILKSPIFLQKAVGSKTGVAIKRIILKNLKQITISFPKSLKEQERIAKIFEQADEIRKKRKESIRLLDLYINSVFREMFSQTTGATSNWDIVKLSDLAEKQKGSMRTGPFGSDLKHSEFVNSGIAVIGIDNAVKNKFAWDQRRFITSEKYNKLKRYTLYPDDVVITIMGTTGRSAVIPQNIPLAVNTKHLAAITLDRKKANPYFVSYSIHSDPEITAQIKSKNRGAIMSGLNLGIIKNLEFKKPPIELQNQFADILLKTGELKEKMLFQLDEMNINFQSLMQKAFN